MSRDPQRRNPDDADARDPSPRDSASRDLGAILDTNLRALLTRAYAPAAPNAEFRDRLQAALLREWSLVHASNPHASNLQASNLGGPSVASESEAALRARRQRFARPILAVAALLAALVGVWALVDWKGAVIGPGPRVEIAGRAARGFDSRERALGFDLQDGRSRLVTDASASASARFASQARLDLAPSTAVTLQAEIGAGHLDLELERGALLVDRYSSGPEWSITSLAGTVRLERGTLELELRGGADPELFARLVDGVARVVVNSGAVPLEPGGSALLRGGRLVVATASASASSSVQGVRQALGADPDAPASSAATDAHETPTFTIEGTLRIPTGSAPDRFVVTRLRHERLPQVSFPQRARFESTERFRLEALTEGTYDVFVEAQGFGLARVLAVVVDAERPHADLEFELLPEIVLTGVVLDASTKMPIASAWVLAEDDLPVQMLPLVVASAEDLGQAAATTRADGSFALHGLAAGSHILRATAPGHGAVWMEAAPQSSPGVPERVEILLSSGGAIEGHTRRADGSADAGSFVIASRIDLEGRRTRMSYGHALTDAQGAYAIEDLPAGIYVLFHFSLGRGSGDPVNPVQVRVEAGLRLTYDIGPKPGSANLRGRLHDQGGAPLGDLDVTLQPAGSGDAFSSWRSARTSASGAFEFLGLAPGRYDVFVGESLGSSFVLAASVEVSGAADQMHDIVAPEGSISGSVQRAGSAAGAVRECWMILHVVRNGREEFAGRTSTDAAGRYRLRWIPAGTYTLVAAPAQDKLAPGRSDGIVLGGSAIVARVDFNLEPGAELTLRVLAADGRAQPGAHIDLTDASGRSVQYTAESVADAHGELHVPGLTPGRWTATASNAGRTSSPASIELIVGEARVLELHLP